MRKPLDDCRTIQELKDLLISYNSDWDIMFRFLDHAYKLGQQDKGGE